MEECWSCVWSLWGAMVLPIYSSTTTMQRWAVHVLRIISLPEAMVVMSWLKSLHVSWMTLFLMLILWLTCDTIIWISEWLYTPLHQVKFTMFNWINAFFYSSGCYAQDFHFIAAVVITYTKWTKAGQQRMTCHLREMQHLHWQRGIKYRKYIMALSLQ